MTYTVCTSDHRPGRVAQSVGHLTRKSGVLGSIPGLATYFRFSFRFSRRVVVSYWRKYVHEVLVNRLGGLSLPRKSVVRLTDRPDMTLDVYRGRKTTMQQQQRPIIWIRFMTIPIYLQPHAAQRQMPLFAWSTSLAVPSSSPAQGEIFSTVNRVPLHTAFHYHPPIVLIRLEYC